jgi:hypothetical protein
LPFFIGSIEPGDGSDPQCSVMFVGPRTREPKENLTAACVARPRWPKGRRRSAAQALGEAESWREEIDQPMHPMTVAEDSCGRDRMSNLSFKVDVEFPDQ